MPLTIILLFLSGIWDTLFGLNSQRKLQMRRSSFDAAIKINPELFRMYHSFFYCNLESLKPLFSLVCYKIRRIWVISFISTVANFVENLPSCKNLLRIVIYSY